MNKVTVEITEHGYSVKVMLDGKTYTQVYKATEYGSKQVSGDDFEEIEEIDDDLYDALNSFFGHDVMHALANRSS
ncbi:hypothetical protein QO009_003014 [Brevibacillus aydinogluensis]|jgi:hypothetical protein|uniref:hypothetical protein n=1 Tax=Brevibacillus aydinogluensis TaxID=927786 RepID=UPI0028936089|nr:hypothetical protein [Brevibacillus aydinogluensis]MDT3417119.1 hypothetical protein [Brevibacillus aydinogluensis]